MAEEVTDIHAEAEALAAAILTRRYRLCIAREEHAPENCQRCGTK